MTTVTLEAYERAEREIKLHEARIGLVVHAVVTLLVWAVVVPVNVVVADEFPWALFVVGGTGTGLFFHWFGYRRADSDIRHQQMLAEERARALV